MRRNAVFERHCHLSLYLNVYKLINIPKNEYIFVAYINNERQKPNDKFS